MMEEKSRILRMAAGVLSQLEPQYEAAATIAVTGLSVPSDQW